MRPAAPYSNYDVDGRPSVGLDEGDDPLLAKLQATYPNRDYSSVVDAPRPRTKSRCEPDDTGSSD